MDPVLAIFQRFGGPARVAGLIGTTTEHAAQMRRRGSIPVRYWPSLIGADPSDGGDRATYAELVAAHARVAPEPTRASA